MSLDARTLQRRVLETIQRLKLWQPQDTVCIAVSGGVDSMVLMHLLHRTQGAHQGQLMVCSIDHGLRPESAIEVSRVAAEAKNLGIPFSTQSLNLEQGPNLAERARMARQRVLTSLGTDAIATGHHQDDQAETVLYHLLRGSGSRGLQGMKAKNGPWVRPLLFEARSTIRDWSVSNAVDWIEDPSNPTSQRGELRRILPLLEGVHGGVSRALARSARLLAREDHLLEQIAVQHWEELHSESGLRRDGLAELHPALQLRLLRRLIGTAQVRAEPLESVVSGALCRPGSLDLGGGLKLVFVSGRLRVES